MGFDIGELLLADTLCFLQQLLLIIDAHLVQCIKKLDKMGVYDEKQLLKKTKTLKKQQLSNIKAHLYRQILSSLRLIKEENNIDIQLHEQMDYARILYNKGLYLQSLKVLDKMKETARAHNQVTYLLQVLFFEKKIEALHITRSMQDRADRLTSEVDEVNKRLVLISKLSNLALQLYSWYIKNGHARNEKDEKAITSFFEDHLPSDSDSGKGFYEKLYLYQSYCWYAFIRQDFLMYYRYTQKWVDLFHAEPQMIKVETGHYIKGMHNLLNAHFDLRNYKQFAVALQRFEKFADSETVSHNDNNRIQTFVYLNTAKMNQHFMLGTFKEGLSLVSYIEEKLDEYSLYLDRHRILVFYYKIASLYFGAGNYKTCIDYLQKIINWKVDLRNDLQCYARLMHRLAHYELGNYDIMEYLSKSVYRFMLKMGNLTVIEEEVFAFIRNTFHLSPRKLKPEFEKLLNKVKGLEKNRFETRAFAYLDIISWLESKVHEKPMHLVIQEKYEGAKKRNYQAA